MRFPCVCSDITHSPTCTHARTRVHTHTHTHTHTHLGWVINSECRGTAVRTRKMIPDHTDWNRGWILRRRWFPCSLSVSTTSAQSAPRWSCAALQGLKVWDELQINAVTRRRKALVSTFLLYHVWISLLNRLKGNAVVDRINNINDLFLILLSKMKTASSSN